MADDIHLSKSYASRIFQQETGSSITDYVTARRLKQAYLLLETTTLSVEEVAGGGDSRMDLISFNYFVNRREPLRYSIGSMWNAAADIKSHKVNC
jgi:hypothetical protein